MRLYSVQLVALNQGKKTKELIPGVLGEKDDVWEWAGTIILIEIVTPNISLTF